MRFIGILAASLMLSACVTSTRALSDWAPTPAGGSITSDDAWVERGRYFFAQEIFFLGNTGDYVACGNFGEYGRSWSSCYDQGISVQGGFVRVDLKWYIDTGKMVPGQTYCLTFRSRERKERNWRNNHQLAEGQRYYSPPDSNGAEHPNIAVYIDWQGNAYITNEYAPHEYQLDNPC